MLCARPSTIAVLPTPGSPIRTELVEHERSRRLRLRAAGGARSRARGLLCAGVPGEELDDLLAHTAQVGAELHEHLGRDPFALTDEAEEDVLGADVVVAELERLAKG